MIMSNEEWEQIHAQYTKIRNWEKRIEFYDHGSKLAAIIALINLFISDTIVVSLTVISMAISCLIGSRYCVDQYVKESKKFRAMCNDVKMRLEQEYINEINRVLK